MNNNTNQNEIAMQTGRNLSQHSIKKFEKELLKPYEKSIYMEPESREL
jgi:hypothetical protein